VCVSGSSRLHPARSHFDLGQNGLGGTRAFVSAAADVYSLARSLSDLGQNGLGGARTCASAAAEVYSHARGGAVTMDCGGGVTPKLGRDASAVGCGSGRYDVAGGAGSGGLRRRRSAHARARLQHGGLWRAGAAAVVGSGRGRVQR
jgi:hypothetical protein